MNTLFTVHRLNPDGLHKADDLADAFNCILEVIEKVIGSGPISSGSGARELACAKTHLELASFYSKKAMAMQKENQIAT